MNMDTDSIVLAILATRATYYNEGDTWDKIVKDTQSAFVNLFPATVLSNETVDEVPF